MAHAVVVLLAGGIHCIISGQQGVRVNSVSPGWVWTREVEKVCVRLGPFFSPLRFFGNEMLQCLHGRHGSVVRASHLAATRFYTSGVRA